MEETQDLEIEKIYLWSILIGAIRSLVKRWNLSEKEIFFVPVSVINEKHPDMLSYAKLLDLCNYNNLPKFKQDWIVELLSDGLPPLKKLETAINNLNEQQKQHRTIQRIIILLSGCFFHIKVINNSKIEFVKPE